MITDPSNTPAPVARLTYTVDEAAAAIGVSKPTIYRLIVRGHLRPVPNLRHKLIPCDQLRDYVNSAQEAVQSPRLFHNASMATRSSSSSRISA